jgi:hypothetical protein
VTDDYRARTSGVVGVGDVAADEPRQSENVIARRDLGLRRDGLRLQRPQYIEQKPPYRFSIQSPRLLSSSIE